MDGTALMPALVAAMANGDAPASPERAVKAGSADETMSPMQKTVSM